MHIIGILPSPPQFFQLFLRLALSLFNTTINAGCRRGLPERRPMAMFDIDERTGFFPQQPLPKLCGEFTLWENALRCGRGQVSLGEDDSDEAKARQPFGRKWRADIAAWPILNTEPLHVDLRLSQRAHHVLAWLVHLYIHSIPPTVESSDHQDARVPRSLAVPLVQVSKFLGIAPILTFADTVLWNWEFVNPDEPLSMTNMRFVNTFSGKEDEENFYHVSAKAELQGIEILGIIDDYNNLPDKRDLRSTSKIAKDLARLTNIVNDINDIIQSVRPLCDPHVFYWDIRPWFKGSNNDGLAEPGWLYEGVPNSSGLDLAGPSAGQSSLMHALDIFLDIDHRLHHRRYPAPSPANKRAELGFMERMRKYMPGKHREYLASLATMPDSLRELAQSTPALREPYDLAVLSLKHLRDQHMRIACLYIVSMSRSQVGLPSGCPASAMIERLEISMKAGNGPVRGTGGNELSILLKAGRDATRRAVLKGN